MSIEGVYAASLTPLREDLSCDEEELFRHCKDLMNRGCAGVLLFGTTGEGPSFSVEEKERVMRSVIKKGLDPHRLIVGIMATSIEDAVKLASLAVELHAAAVLLAPPFFYKNIHEEGVIAFYREVIQRVNSPALKVILYHIPQFSGVSMTLPIIRSLRKEFPDAVIGLKESEGNLPLMKEILSSFPHFCLFVGNERYISELVRLGAIGAISGTANAYPELIASLYAFGKDPSQPNLNEKMEIIAHILSRYRLAAIKYLVEKQKGPVWHLLRPPLVPLNQKQRLELSETLA